jgi:lipopolysaccharide/colanic/teichoic acid biosynthesis glycosyltransferase
MAGDIGPRSADFGRNSIEERRFSAPRRDNALVRRRPPGYGSLTLARTFEHDRSANAPAFYARRKKRANELCQILIRNGDVKPEDVRRALRLQRERGGQIGRILVKIGACTEPMIAHALVEQVKLLEDAGEARSLAVQARARPDIAGLEVESRPWLTSLAILASDVAVLGVIAGIAAGCDHLVAHHLSPSLLHHGFSALASCVVVLAAVEMYSPIARSPPHEIRTNTLAVTLVFACAALVAAFRHGELIPWHVHALLFLEWVLACIALPTVRAIARRRLSKTAWWGVPVVVLGAGKMGRLLVGALQARPQIGLRPVLVLDDDLKKHGSLRARVDEDDKIHVNSIRDVPVASSYVLPSSHDIASAARLQTESTKTALQPAAVPPAFHAPTEAAPRATLETRPRAPLEHEGSAPRTIRSPVPPAAPSVPASPSSRPPPTYTTVTISSDPPPMEPERPSMKTSALGSSRPGAKVEPSWLHHVPESVKGYVRGQFAEIEGVPIVGALDLAPFLAKRLGISYAIVAMPGQSARKLLQVTERVGGAFSHILVIPDLFGLASMGVPAREVGGVVGVELRQQLLLPGPRFAKRAMDVALTMLGGIFVFPVILLLAILIKLDSKGPTFYPQKRLGRGGASFTALKFRTMYGDGETRLKAVLAADPALQREYDEFHKLSRDPRVTRIGRVLRKYSMDELPQLLNVLLGDMSLVGPRPYLEREIPDMAHHEKIILRAMPGLTGLWQVSDRNATGFAERVTMDVHYVRN